MVRAINLRLALQATAIKVSANLVTQLIIHLRAPGGHSPFDEQQVIEFAIYGFVGSQVGNVIQFILEDCFPTGHAMRANEVLPQVQGDVMQVLEKKDDDKKDKKKPWFSISPDLIWRNVVAKLILDQTIGLAISGSVFLICTNIARVSHFFWGSRRPWRQALASYQSWLAHLAAGFGWSIFLSIFAMKKQH
ncbi:hypothetical protein NXS19_006485 [Fusarium pseudograminearum]|nr:hypothetical protein NXS19_006485 [Fusarium pseudograminearum]